MYVFYFTLLLFKDGKIYEGFWTDGVQQGKGKLKQSENSEFKTCLYRKGKKLKWITQEEFDDPNFPSEDFYKNFP